MNWVQVQSEMLAAAAYDPAWQQLYLEFRTGEIYCYRGVPIKAYQELLVAKSKGTYARAHILNSYPYQRIHPALAGS